MVLALIEQQQVDRNDTGLQSRDRFHDRGELGAGQWIPALFPNRIVVDGHDCKKIGRRSWAAHEKTQIGQYAFGPVKQPDVAAPVAYESARSSASSVWKALPVTNVHCPRRASRASTRGCAQRFTTRGSVPGS